MRGRYRRLRRAWKPAAVFGALMFLSAAAAGPAAAQQAVCPNPAGNPAAGDWISCNKDSSATDSIVIDLDDFDIDDSEMADPIDAAVNAHHGGSGDDADIDIDVTGGSITVSGRYGIQARHCELDGDHCESGGAKTGDIDIDVTDAVIVVNDDDLGYQGKGIRAEHGNTGNIDIDATDVSVRVEQSASHGISAWHRGTGKTRVAVTRGSFKLVKSQSTGIQAACNVSTCGSVAMTVTGAAIATETEEGTPKPHTVVGIKSWHKGAGDTDIDVTGGSIAIAGKEDAGSSQASYGIDGWGRGAGNVAIDVDGTEIDMTGDRASGILGLNNKASSAGGIDIGVSGGASVTTGGSIAYGILGVNSGASSTGDIGIDLSDRASVTTGGSSAYGILGWNYGASSTGDIDIDLSGRASVTTGGSSACGICGLNQGASSMGDIDIGLSSGASVTTGGSSAYGIYGLNQGASSTGAIDIGVSGGADVDTTGANAYGIYGLNYGASSTGGIAIDLSGGASVTTSGARAHGIYAGHASGKGTMAVTVGAGASVTATGANASGVQIGRFNTATNALERAAGYPPGAGIILYRGQTATVNGSVLGGSGDAAGVYLAGGGRAVVGPAGTVRAGSGIAILAARKLLSEPAPTLHVSLNPGGRRIAEVLGDDWIVNDGGHTTIFVNGVMLHDGLNGATRNRAVNGEWHVAIRRDGRTVDRTEPGQVDDKPPLRIDDRGPGLFRGRLHGDSENRHRARPGPRPEPESRPEPDPTRIPTRTPTRTRTESTRIPTRTRTSTRIRPESRPGPDNAVRPDNAARFDSRPRRLRRRLGRRLRRRGAGRRGAAGPAVADVRPVRPRAGGAGSGDRAAPGFRAVRRRRDAPLGARPVRPAVGGGRRGGRRVRPGRRPGRRLLARLRRRARHGGGAGGRRRGRFRRRYGLRGGWRSEALFAGLSASRADWKAETSFAAPAGGLVAGAFDARQTDLRLGAGARLALGGGVSLAPKAEVFAGRLERGAQRAEGAAFRADMPDVEQDYRGWKAGLGLASGWRDGPRGVKLRPALNLSALRTESRSDSFALKQSDRLGIVETSVRARMADAPETVLGLAAGVEAAGPGGLRLNFGYAALKSSGGGIDHALAAGLNLRF